MVAFFSISIFVEFGIEINVRLWSIIQSMLYFNLVGFYDFFSHFSNVLVCLWMCEFGWGKLLFFFFFSRLFHSRLSGIENREKEELIR